MSSPSTPIIAARALKAERSFAAPHPDSHACDICNEEAHPIAHRYNMLVKHIFFAWRQENHQPIVSHFFKIGAQIVGGLSTLRVAKHTRVIGKDSGSKFNVLRTI